MAFIVACTVIVWLLVVIAAFAARPAQKIDDAKENFQEKEHQE